MIIAFIGYAGLAGTGEIVSTQKERLAKRFSVSFLEKTVALSERAKEEAGKVRDLLTENKVTFLETTEGCYNALWMLATGDGNKNHGFGIEADLKKIPVRQETIEITNEVDVNPYKIPSSGAFVALFENEEQVYDIFSKKCVPFGSIGGIIESNRRIIKIGVDKITYLEPPRG